MVSFRYVDGPGLFVCLFVVFLGQIHIFVCGLTVTFKTANVRKEVSPDCGRSRACCSGGLVGVRLRCTLHSALSSLTGT